MNYKQKIEANKILKGSFHKNYPEGCVKVTGTVSVTHEVTKASVCHWLKANGYDVWTEGRLKDGSRPDIIAIRDHIGYIIEILHSESESRFQDKLEGSYGEFMVLKVYTKDFDYKTFKL